MMATGFTGLVVLFVVLFAASVVFVVLLAASFYDAFELFEPVDGFGRLRVLLGLRLALR